MCTAHQLVGYAQGSSYNRRTPGIKELTASKRVDRGSRPGSLVKKYHKRKWPARPDTNSLDRPGSCSGTGIPRSVNSQFRKVFLHVIYSALQPFFSITSPALVTSSGERRREVVNVNYRMDCECNLIFRVVNPMGGNTKGSPRERRAPYVTHLLPVSR